MKSKNDSYKKSYYVLEFTKEDLDNGYKDER
jgi:hypothetical protein